jgi:hypothetical protein
MPRNHVIETCLKNMPLIVAREILLYAFNMACLQNMPRNHAFETCFENMPLIVAREIILHAYNTCTQSMPPIHDLELVPF